MSPRTTGLLLVAALLLGAFVYLYEIRGADPEGGDPVDREALFEGLAASDVEWIELTTSDGQEARAERSAEGWRLVSPMLFAADDVALDGMAGQLVGLEVEGRVSGDAALEGFGLGDEARRVRFGAGAAEHVLEIGKRTPVGSNTYVRAGDAGVAYVTTWRTNALDKTLTDLRDRRVLDFDHASVEGVEVRWPEGSVSLERVDGTWMLLRPVQEKADRATVETLLSDLAFLSADGFVDAPLGDDEAGLATPALAVRLWGRGGDVDADGAGGEPFSIGLAFGGRYEGARVVRGGAGALYLVEPERLDDVPRDVLAYRFKSLGAFEVADARALALAFGGEAAEPRRVEAVLADGRWTVQPDAVTDERIRGMVAALGRLTGTAIVAERLGPDELAALGLEPARVRARVSGEGGEVLAEVALGRVDAGRGIFARRVDSEIVYRVDESVRERLPTSAADFDARFVGPGEADVDAEGPQDAAQDDAVDDELPVESREGFRDG